MNWINQASTFYSIIQMNSLIMSRIIGGQYHTKEEKMGSMIAMIVSLRKIEEASQKLIKMFEELTMLEESTSDQSTP